MACRATLIVEVVGDGVSRNSSNCVRKSALKHLNIQVRPVFNVVRDQGTLQCYPESAKCIIGALRSGWEYSLGYEGQGPRPTVCRCARGRVIKIEDTAVKEASDRWSRNRVTPGHPASHWALFTPVLFRREAWREVLWRPESGP